MATKRVIQAPTINNSWQITWGSSAPWGYLRKLPNELPWWDGPNSVRVIQTPQTDNNWNIIWWNGVRTWTNTAEDPSTYNFTSITWVKQNTWNRVIVDGKEYILDGWARNATQNRTATPSTTFKDNSAVLATAWKTGVTKLPQGKTDSLPWVTKYAGQDQTEWGIKYWNNQAGIDFLNGQNKAPMQWVYNPTPPPTVATQRNPVIKKTLPKEEAPVRPDIQSMDLPTIQENIDRLTYKVNSGKNLTEDEYVTFNQLRRQATDMMKPQSLTGGLDNLMTTQQNDITTTQKTLDEQNARDMEAFTRSQEAFKQSQFAELDRADEEKKKTLGYILGAQWSWAGSYTVEALNKITENTVMQKQAYQDSIQAKLDLYESQQRKDSAETIQKMKDRLYSTQLKAAEFDVANLQEINKYNQEQGKDVMKNLDDLKAMSDSIIASSTPLTEDQKAQAEVIGNLLIDENWKVNDSLLAAYRKTNPNLMPYATSIAVQAKKRAEENKLAMQWLDADIKKAQLNKLLNPDIDRKPTGETDANGNPILYDPKNPTNTAVIPVAPTDIGWLSGADLAKTLASWKIDWKKFFGVYATGDPDGTQFASIYDKAANMWLDAYMKSRQSRGSKITADMVNQASIATGVDPITIAAKMAQDSWMGTQGKGARNNNPWNVGQFDSLDAKWITVKWYNTLEDWVLAVADNFKKRQDALLSVAWKSMKNTELTNSDIAKFNDNTFNPDKLKSSVDKEKYKKYLDQKSNVMWNKDSSIQDIIAYSAWGKELDATAIQRLDKYSTVLWQLDWIQKQISTMDTWPILWKLRAINPYDTNAQVLKAQLQALIPNLARWVYGEVWVLTDADIKNYAQTIPNLTQTKDVQNAILALTLDTLAWGYKNQLQTLAASKRDVSWFAWLYESIKWQADAIRSSIWWKTPSQNTTGWWRRQG